MSSITFKKELKNISMTVIAAILSALALHIFVEPADFAPAGVDGLTVMLQEITGISMGWFSLAINLPLLIAAWFILKKRYVVYTVLFIVVSSVLSVILKSVGFYQFEASNEKLLVALVSGAILGIRTGIMLRIEASSGGIDILAGFIQRSKTHLNVETLICVICCTISILSVVVYHNVLSILLSLIQMVVFDKVAGRVLLETRNAIEFKIITKKPDMLKERIITELQHGATVLESKGAFSDEKSNLIITVVNIRQIPHFLSIIEEEKAFVYYSEVKGVKGNFRWKKDDEVK